MNFRRIAPAYQWMRMSDKTSPSAEVTNVTHGLSGFHESKVLIIYKISFPKNYLDRYATLSL